MKFFIRFIKKSLKKSTKFLCEKTAKFDFKFQVKKIEMPFENYDSDTFEKS